MVYYFHGQSRQTHTQRHRTHTTQGVCIGLWD